MLPGGTCVSGVVRPNQALTSLLEGERRGPAGTGFAGFNYSLGGHGSLRFSRFLIWACVALIRFQISVSASSNTPLTLAAVAARSSIVLVVIAGKIPP